MTKSKYYVSESQLTFNGHTFTATRINNDINGNARYVVHVNDIEMMFDNEIPYQFTKYRAKWYGGGYVIQSFNLINDLKLIDMRRKKLL